MRAGPGYLDGFFAGGNNAEFDADGRGIFIIVGVIAHADQVCCSCKQDHHPQYGAAKNFMKKRSQSIPLMAGRIQLASVPETSAIQVCKLEIRVKLTAD
jgi:hypothetical protein